MLIIMDIENARRLKKGTNVTFKSDCPFSGSYQLEWDSKYDTNPTGGGGPVVWLHLSDVKGGSRGESDYHHDLFDEPVFA